MQTNIIVSEHARILLETITETLANSVDLDQIPQDAAFDKDLCLRQRFLLTMICCPIYPWVEVSREVDKSRARSASDIFTDD